jgi:hypothetical protein
VLPRWSLPVEEIRKTVDGLLDAIEKVIKALKWFADRYPAFWRWLLPDPPETRIVLEDDECSAVLRNTIYWRATWRWTGLLPLVYIFLLGNVLLPWSLAAFCAMILTICFLRVRLYPIRRDPRDVSIWRQAATIWTWAVFIIPAIWWKLIDFVDLAYPDANVSSPPIPRGRPSSGMG